ncbi:FAD-dependent oxidoreductase [Mycobacterium vicinigordonae]|uniref:FAD-dependent oxidoreductase n=1 Tax=Mycobacterium vicinigordonae TaxID=1719132 RepID=A0A7D6E8P4_9MYCO|nr:FAD-dependent oxidoreductase [Mycobacterium vicinigordonae]QLL07565.1 FAD-dependent oxidoreductase [Mycobacterium vicinigordonae]
MPDFDVVVIGSGAAGLCAALEANRAGARVLVAESEAVIGGSSRLSGGIIMAAGTRLQQAHGIEDSVEDLFYEYMTFNQWKLEPAVVHRLVDNARSAVEWLEDMGVEFVPELYPAGKERVRRSHMPAGAGQAVVNVLHAQCKRAGVEFAMGRRIDRLVVSDGRVRGVAAGDDELSANSVVIATGGFAASKEMLQEYWPEGLQGGDWTWYIGEDGHGSRGDAFALGAQVDAQIAGRGRGVMLLEPNFGHNINIYNPGWLIMVNGEGRRFFDETYPYSTTQPAAFGEPKPIYAIWDHGAKCASNEVPDLKDLYMPTEVATSHWQEPILDEMAARGVVVQAESIEKLAAEIGISPENLAGTVATYNRDVRNGKDSAYFKRPDLMRSIDTPPYYATELRFCTIGLTTTGLRINADAEVIDGRSQVIPGLYAAGECTGGIIGDVYMGTGNSYANAVVFGRVAGQSAAASALSRADHDGSV